MRHSKQWLSEKVGGSGRASAEHGADGAGSPGGFPSGKGLGAFYRCGDSGSQCPGQAHRLSFVGEARPEQDSHADQSQAPGAQSAPPKPVVRISGIFRVQAFQPGKCFLAGAWGGAHRLADRGCVMTSKSISYGCLSGKLSRCQIA